MVPRLAVLFVISPATWVWAQTTQGAISGVALDRRTSLPLEGATVVCTHETLPQPFTTSTGRGGLFVFPSLSPGLYRITVSSSGYQDQELEDLELPVAGRLEIRLFLRPSWDVWSKGSNRFTYALQERVVNFFASDAQELRPANADLSRPESDVLSTGASFVVNSEMLRSLPLPGRDVYTALVTLPGVTSDATTARGLGLSVNGQRPAASNYLLDGVETNNYLLSGPLLSVAPEAIQEYRVSTSNFSAEYGRTAGFLATAITRAGTPEWHGQGYSYFKNQALNANDFQRNSGAMPRRSLHESQVGAVVGGPLWRRRGVFASGSVEHLRFRTDGDPDQYFLPTIPGSVSGRGADLLRTYAAGPAGLYTVAPPASLDRTLALLRLDKQWTTGSLLMGRVAIARSNRPDFSWTPYRDFVSGLNQDATSAALVGVKNLTTSTTVQLRASWSGDNAGFDRSHPKIPYVYVEPAPLAPPTLLPGSQLAREYRNRGSNVDVSSTLTYIAKGHTWNAGGGVLARRLNGYWKIFPSGAFAFRTIDGFARDQATYFELPLDGLTQAVTPPRYDRTYTYTQSFAFFQGSVRVTSRLQFNYGLRYENFGRPANTGSAKDTLLEWGEGAIVEQKLQKAHQVRPAAGDQPLYSSDNNDFAPRFGMAWRISDAHATTLRAAYGVFYDRPFDNLWQSLRLNGINRGALTGSLAATAYQNGLGAIDAADWTNEPFYYRRTYAYQPGIRTPYVQSAFIGLSQPFAGRWSAEIAAHASAGRKLIITDRVNRSERDTSNRLLPRSNPDLRDVNYRSNQGSSTYSALTASLRYRAALAEVYVTYSWSHTIDNQSEALLREFSDLSPAFAGALPALPSRGASFLEAHNSRRDRGSADFDQRHNLVTAGVWNLPSARHKHWSAVPLRNWRVGHLAAFRSGQPFTAIDSAGDRLDLVDPSQPYAHTGTQILRPQSFQRARPGTKGTLGRNALAGPGLFSLDVSLARTFRIERASRMAWTLRADAYNLLNHANLGNPDPVFGDPGFGVATFGRLGRDPNLPAQLPLAETARNVQLLFRLDF